MKVMAAALAAVGLIRLLDIAWPTPVGPWWAYLAMTIIGSVIYVSDVIVNGTNEQ